MSASDPVATNGDPEALREQIRTTRAELGDTVEALAHKTDVNSRAQERVQETKESVSQTASAVGEQVSQNRTPLLIGGGAAVLLAIWLIRR